MKPFAMDSVYQEISDLAAIFNVRERGSEFIAELQGRLARASHDADARSVSRAYWFADTKAPYMAGCCGAPGVITKPRSTDLCGSGRCGRDEMPCLSERMGLV